MKIFIFNIFFLIPILGFSATGQEAIRNLLEAVENNIPEPYRSPVAAVEIKHSLNDGEAFQQLETEIISSWREILPILGDMDINETKKALFFKATQVLPLENYLEMSTLAMDRWEAGDISRMQAMWILFPAEKHLRDMWTMDDPPESLVNLAHKVANIYPDKSKDKVFFVEFLHKHSPSIVDGAEEQASGSDQKTFRQSPVLRNEVNESANHISVDASEQAPEQSSRWWIRLVGALIVLGGLGVMLRRKKF